MRVVFDTNVLVSALVFPGGRGEAALQRIVEEKDRLLLSKPILDELLGILGRKFARDAEALSHAAVFLTELTQSISPRQRLHFLSLPSRIMAASTFSGRFRCQSSINYGAGRCSGFARCSPRPTWERGWG